MRRANYSIAREDAASVTISDNGPWDYHPTVTNDAENVVADLAEYLAGRRRFYYDSEGSLDELIVKDGRLAGFAPGQRR